MIVGSLFSGIGAPETAWRPLGWIMISVDGPPRGKGRPRFGRAGAFVRVYTDAETEAYEGAIKTYARLAMAGRTPLEGPCDVSICVHLPVPQSWSERKRRAALAGSIYPTSKPDTDNFQKIALDACNKVVFADDSQVVDLHGFKRYSDRPRLVIIVSQKVAAAEVALTTTENRTTNGEAQGDSTSLPGF